VQARCGAWGQDTHAASRFLPRIESRRRVRRAVCGDDLLLWRDFWGSQRAVKRFLTSRHARMTTTQLHGLRLDSLLTFQRQEPSALRLATDRERASCLRELIPRVRQLCHPPAWVAQHVVVSLGPGFGQLCLLRHGPWWIYAFPGGKVWRKPSEPRQLRKIPPCARRNASLDAPTCRRCNCCR
jgi:hypothetical protein